MAIVGSSIQGLDGRIRQMEEMVWDGARWGAVGWGGIGWEKIGISILFPSKLELMELLFTVEYSAKGMPDSGKRAMEPVSITVGTQGSMAGFDVGQRTSGSSSQCSKSFERRWHLPENQRRLSVRVASKVQLTGHSQPLGCSWEGT